MLNLQKRKTITAILYDENCLKLQEQLQSMGFIEAANAVCKFEDNCEVKLKRLMQFKKTGEYWTSYLQ